MPPASSEERAARRRADGVADRARAHSGPSSVAAHELAHHRIVASAIAAAGRRSAGGRVEHGDRGAKRRSASTSDETATTVAPVRVALGAQEIVDLRRGDRIEAGGRLVVDARSAARAITARASADALLHAARQLGGQLVLAAGQADRAQPRRRRARRISSRRQLPAALERKRDVVADGQEVEQRVVLEQHADRARTSSSASSSLPDVVPTTDAAASGATRPHRSLSSTLLPPPPGPMRPSLAARERAGRRRRAAASARGEALVHAARARSRRQPSSCMPARARARALDCRRGTACTSRAQRAARGRRRRAWLRSVARASS